MITPAESLQLAAGVGASVFGQAAQLAEVMGAESVAAGEGGEAREQIDTQAGALVQRLQTVCAQVLEMVKLLEKS